MSTSAPGRIIIVGAGLAGAKAAQSLRREGHAGPLTLIGAEAEAPYNRPPLSKEYLNDAEQRTTINVLSDGWYADHDVDLRLATRVGDIDPGRHRVILTSGEELGFEKLLLATGSRVRPLALPGADLDRVLYLRTLDDSDKIRNALSTASRVAIIGGGWIGLEIAAAARMHGVDVTVLEHGRFPLQKVLGPEVAQHFAALHLSHGVHLCPEVQVAAITGLHGRATGVTLTDGTRIVADAVIVGVGATPRTELAERAGLAVGNGVHVNASLRTSHPDVFAAGDVANAWHPSLAQRVRVEHWSNAAWQPRVAARAMLDIDASYDRLPYFYSDQYDLSMEYTGYVGAQGYDRVVFRGEPESQSYIAFWLRGTRLLAGMNVNTPRVVRDITALVTSGRDFSADELADGTRPLSTLLGN
ncbi:MAG: FAD-dependent oxidoreductase [Arachnia sp.]